MTNTSGRLSALCCRGSQVLDVAKLWKGPRSLCIHRPSDTHTLLRAVGRTLESIELLCTCVPTADLKAIEMHCPNLSTIWLCPEAAVRADYADLLCSFGGNLLRACLDSLPNERAAIVVNSCPNLRCSVVVKPGESLKDKLDAWGASVKDLEVKKRALWPVLMRPCPLVERIVSAGTEDALHALLGDDKSLLTSLELHGCDFRNVCDDVLELWRHARCLQKVVFDGHFDDVRMLQSLVCYAPRLQKVDICLHATISSFSDTLLKNIASTFLACRHLRDLRVNGVYWEFFRPVADRCAWLRLTRKKPPFVKVLEAVYKYDVPFRSFIGFNCVKASYFQIKCI